MNNMNNNCTQHLEMGKKKKKNPKTTITTKLQDQPQVCHNTNFNFVID
jgi:hypothetical protein